MVDASSFAIVVDHTYKLGGQKKLAKATDGSWLIWKWLSGKSPKTTVYPTEAQAREAYAEIKLEDTKVNYDSTPVPHLVNISDDYWSEIGER